MKSDTYYLSYCIQFAAQKPSYSVSQIMIKNYERPNNLLYLNPILKP